MCGSYLDPFMSVFNKSLSSKFVGIKNVNVLCKEVKPKFVRASVDIIDIYSKKSICPRIDPCVTSHPWTALSDI